MGNRHHSTARFLWLAMLSLPLAPFAVPARGQAPPVTMDTIVKAWKAHQDRIRSARITWTERETVPRGSISLLWRAAGIQIEGVKPGSIVPPRDVTFTSSLSICLDGEKMRYERETQSWSAEKDDFVATPEVVVFDDEVGQTFNPQGRSFATWPLLSIRRGNPSARSLPLAPMLIALRPQGAGKRLLRADALELTGSRARIQGKSCLELQEQRPGTSVRRIWVDPSRNYVILRSLITRGGRTWNKQDIRYVQAAQGIWIPTGWDNLTNALGGKVGRFTQATVTAHQINIPLDPGGFTIDPPAGTRVTDSRDPKNELDYIVKEGGSKRMILPEDIGATYAQMLHSEPGEALGKRPGGFLSWRSLSVAALIGGAVAFGFLIWRRYRAQYRVS